MYIDNLKNMYENKVLKEFLEKCKNYFEDYLKRLEIDCKIFVWRSGVLEDMILSFNNCLEIDRVFSLICYSILGFFLCFEYDDEECKK